MIDNSSYPLLLSSFLIVCSLMHFTAGNLLRPNLLIDPYFFLYILIGSMVAVHIDIFLNNKISDEFIISYSLSIFTFLTSFILSSYIYNNRLGKLDTLTTMTTLPKNLFGKSSIIILSLYSIIFLYFDIEESLIKFNSIDSFYSQNLIYLNENKFARYLLYAKGSISLVFTVFLVYLTFYYKRTKFFEKIFIFTVIFLYVLSTLLAGNRSSAVTSFLIFGLISVSRYTPIDTKLKIKKFHSIIIIFGVIFAVFLTAQSLDNELILALAAFLERFVLGSDIGYRYHLSGSAIDLSNFREYDFLYFIKPILTALGLQASSPGIGPQVLIAAGIDEFGKGPIPTFYYDSFIISKSYFFPIIYSTAIGFFIPYSRFHAIRLFEFYLAKANAKGVLLSCVFFLMCTGPTGDYLSFFNNVIVNLLSLGLLFLLLYISNMKLYSSSNTGNRPLEPKV